MYGVTEFYIWLSPHTSESAVKITLSALADKETLSSSPAQVHAKLPDARLEIIIRRVKY